MIASMAEAIGTGSGLECATHLGKSSRGENEQSFTTKGGAEVVELSRNDHP